MHHMKMRLGVLALAVGLLGAAAVFFSTFAPSQTTEATTMSGPWKQVGVITSVKKAGTGSEWVVTTPKSLKADDPIKGDYAIVLGPTVPPGNEYPTKAWRVVANKNVGGVKEIRLTQVIPGECAPAAPPVGAAMTLWTGPCNKPAGGGGPPNLQGVSDLIVDNALPGVDLFHCMFRTDIDGGGVVKNAAVCSDNTGALGTGDAAEPINDLPGEGVSGDAGGVGPPPPPPYAVAPPAKGAGTYNGVDIVTTTCFPDVGTSVNIIAVTTVPAAVANLAADGDLDGSVLIYVGQTNAACDALTPVGVAPAPLGLTIYPAADNAGCPAGNCAQAPWRTAGDTDWDNDGCSDADELWQMKPGVVTKCGDDPWNPFDVTPPSIDAAGTYSLTAIAARQNVGAPGFYYDCQADINQTGKALTARVSCYIDSAAVVINPKAVPAPNANATTCPPAPAAYCGDGISGAPPPGTTVGTYPTSPRLLSKIGAGHTVLTGTVDNAQNVIKLAGCFKSNVDNPPAGKPGGKVSFLGNTYVEAVINLHTGHGQVNLWTAQTLANCTGGTPVGAGGVIPIHAARQALKAAPPAGRDTDGDGCPNKRELSDVQGQGGLRDAMNTYDYFNPTNDGLNRVDDILAVVGQYFIDDLPGPIDMKSETDRTAIAGANEWNLGPPNGLQRVDDILAIVKQYFHDC